MPYFVAKILMITLHKHVGVYPLDNEKGWEGGQSIYTYEIYENLLKVVDYKGKTELSSPANYHKLHTRFASHYGWRISLMKPAPRSLQSCFLWRLSYQEQIVGVST